MGNIGRYKRILLLFFMFILKCLKTGAYDGYLGCFEDKIDRLLEKRLENSDSNTSEECKQRCDRAGFRYAGTEYGPECYCGNSLRYVNTKASGCDTPCPGNNKEHCGGVWRLSLFQTRRFTTTTTSTTLLVTSTRSTKVATSTTSTSTTAAAAATTTTTETTNITTVMPVTITELTTEKESIDGRELSTKEDRSEDSSYSTVYISVSVVATLTTVVIVITVYLVKRRRNHDENGLSDCSQDMVEDDCVEKNIYENEPTARYAEWVELGNQTDQHVIGHIYENPTTIKRANHQKQTSVKGMNNFVENCIYENQIVSDTATELGNEQPENNYEILQSERRLGEVYLSIDNVNQK